MNLFLLLQFLASSSAMFTKSEFFLQYHNYSPATVTDHHGGGSLIAKKYGLMKDKISPKLNNSAKFQAFFDRQFFRYVIEK